jgi:hypothetical protein
MGLFRKNIGWFLELAGSKPITRSQKDYFAKGL